MRSNKVFPVPVAPNKNIKHLILRYFELVQGIRRLSNTSGEKSISSMAQRGGIRQFQTAFIAIVIAGCIDPRGARAFLKRQSAYLDCSCPESPLRKAVSAGIVVFHLGFV